MECEFCRGIFLTSKTLKTHQIKAKYCQEIQVKKRSSIFGYM